MDSPHKGPVIGSVDVLYRYVCVFRSLKLGVEQTVELSVIGDGVPFMWRRHLYIGPFRFSW